MAGVLGRRGLQERFEFRRVRSLGLIIGVAFASGLCVCVLTFFFVVIVDVLVLFQYLTFDLLHTPPSHSTPLDIAELDGGKVAEITFPNQNDLTVFEVDITPSEGFWKSATYKFQFEIPDHYPHTPPKVHCDTKIYHPNINLEGKVCLNILREDWKPVLDINAVIYGLIYLFYDPNPDDPLNHEAAELFRKDRAQFQRLVQRTLRGGVMDGVHFQKLI